MYKEDICRKYLKDLAMLLGLIINDNYICTA